MVLALDPNNYTQAVDLEREIKLIRYYRDVPRGERWFYFTMEGVSVMVRTIWTGYEERKYFQYILDVDHLWTGYSTMTPKHKLSFEEFRKVFVPALTEAIVFLERSAISPKWLTEGWDVRVNCTN